jgi:hypothetical protein
MLNRVVIKGNAMKIRHLFTTVLAVFALNGCAMYQTYSGDGNGGDYYYAEQTPAQDYYYGGYGCDYAFCADYRYGYGSFGYFGNFGYFGSYGYPYAYNCYGSFGGCAYPYGYGASIHFGSYPYGFGGSGYFGYPFYMRPYLRPAIQPRPPRQPVWGNHTDHDNRSPHPGNRNDARWPWRQPGNGESNRNRPPHPQTGPRPGNRPVPRPVSQPAPFPRAENAPRERPNIAPGAVLQPAPPLRRQPGGLADGERAQPEPRIEPHPSSRPGILPYQAPMPPPVSPAPRAENNFRNQPGAAPAATQPHLPLPQSRTSDAPRSQPQPAASPASPRRLPKTGKDEP